MPKKDASEFFELSRQIVRLLPIERPQRGRNQIFGLCEALSEVVDPESLGGWFVAPNGAFDGQKPIEVIERGEIDRLWDMVLRLRSGMPG